MRQTFRGFACEVADSSCRGGGNTKNAGSPEQWRVVICGLAVAIAAARVAGRTHTEGECLVTLMARARTLGRRYYVARTGKALGCHYCLSVSLSRTLMPSLACKVAHLHGQGSRGPRVFSSGRRAPLSLCACPAERVTATKFCFMVIDLLRRVRGN